SSRDWSSDVCSSDLFREFRRLTSDTVEGRMLLELIGAGVAIYSPHTAFDSAARGINQQLAEGLDLVAIAPLRPNMAAAMIHPAESGRASCMDRSYLS